MYTEERVVVAADWHDIIPLVETIGGHVWGFQLPDIDDLGIARCRQILERLADTILLSRLIVDVEMAGPPASVAYRAKALKKYGFSSCTVHAFQGLATIVACAHSLRHLYITTPSGLDDVEYKRIYHASPLETVSRLAMMASLARRDIPELTGIICAPEEADTLARVLDPALTLIPSPPEIIVRVGREGGSLQPYFQDGAQKVIVPRADIGLTSPWRALDRMEEEVTLGMAVQASRSRSKERTRRRIAI